MTERELEILALIKANPMLPQQKMADMLGITRSAVAGHIMNLTNKGAICGKGYILASDDYAVVIGGANMDILGSPSNALNIGDSNVGAVTCSAGGVGRNIAENLARLGAETRLITAIGNDAYGEMITAQCRQAGVDMSASLQVDDAATSTYLSVLDSEANMHVAINDMAILERLTAEVLKGAEAILQRAKLIVVDTNLTSSALAYLFNNFAHVPIFVDTVSSVKAIKIKPYLSSIHTLKPNLTEAQALSGITMRTNEDLPAIANWFHQQSVKRLFISLGSAGVFVSDSKTQQLVATKAIEMVNANGAGDAFLAGLAHGWLKQWSIMKSTQFAMAAAQLALSHIATINPNMSEIAINRIMKESSC